MFGQFKNNSYLCIGNHPKQQIRFNDTKMKENSPLLMFAGLQAVLAVIGLMLVTALVGYHLLVGHLGLFGAMMASAIFCLAYRLTVRSIRELREILENKDNVAKDR